MISLERSKDSCTSELEPEKWFSETKAQPKNTPIISSHRRERLSGESLDLLPLKSNLAAEHETKNVSNLDCQKTTKTNNNNNNI